MSRVCIIGASNLINISLISIYTSYLEKNKVDYDLIYWDRKGLTELNKAKNAYKYIRLLNGVSFWKKILYYLGFSLYAHRILIKNDYEYVIIWQTSVAYLLIVLLLTKYRHKYILNIRDYIAEKKIIFEVLIRILTKYSVINTISSKGFLSFLPTKRDYQLIESVNSELIHGEKIIAHSRISDKIKIGFVGSCRYFDENRRIIDRLANDERFELWFCGENSYVLKNYALMKSISNVFVIDTFPREDTLSIFGKFDIINSCFGCDNLANSTLVPIRLFNALSQGLPVMASKGMFLANLLKSTNLGIEVDSFADNLGDYIFNYISNLDYDKFSFLAHEYLLGAVNTNVDFQRKLDEFLMS